jgi:hypothetical protein
VDVGETMVAAAVVVGEALMIEAQAVEKGGVEVVDVDGVFDRLGAMVVGASMRMPSAETASGHPDREPLMIVVAAVVLAAVGGAAELASPEHHGVVQEAAGGEVLD